MAGGGGVGEISNPVCRQEKVPFEPPCHPMHSLICVPCNAFQLRIRAHAHHMRGFVLLLPCLIAQVGVDGCVIHTERPCESSPCIPMLSPYLPACVSASYVEPDMIARPDP